MYDVLVVGYGPTGMLAAILLGQAGHKVAVIERYKTLYNLPRVGIVHDDVLRMFQEIGLAEKIAPATFFLPEYELGFNGEILMSNKVADHEIHGWPEMTSIYQPAFEAELDKLVRSLPNVEIFQGQTVVALEQTSDQVDILVEDEEGGTQRLTGRYLIGADGGNSFIRTALGIDYEDLGFDQSWLVIDGKAKRPPRPDLPLLRQFCEPEQPGMTMQMGPDHRRWSFMIFADQDPTEAVKHENVWKLLDRAEGGTPDEFELIRVVNYQFRSLIAERWREKRVFLAGDSAHQMPPFLAQGMCSGFRDSHNLAWKLDMVLKGAAAPDFLDTYEAEHGPNSRATIIASKQVGENVNERDPEKIRIRNENLRALQAENENSPTEKKLIAFRVPGFEHGFVANGGKTSVKGAGDAFGQGRVQHKAKQGLFDDVAGRGFMILSRKGDPASVLSKEDQAFWQEIGGLIKSFEATGSDGLTELDNYYTDLMDQYECDVIIKRSDYYMFGACQKIEDLPDLIADLRAQLNPA